VTAGQNCLRLGSLLQLPGRGVAVGDRERFVDRLRADAQVVVGRDERRRDEEDVPAAEDVDVPLHELVLQRVRERARRAVPALERLARRAVLHEVDADEEALAAHLADRGVALGDRPQVGEQLRAARRRALDEALLAVGRDRRDAGGAGERVAAVRRAGPEHVVVEVLRDLRAHRHAAERHVAGVHALGEGEDVGHDAGPVLDAEPLPGAAEAGHDLVDDEEDAVPVAERAEPLEVAGRRDDEPGRPDDRLEEDRGDVLRPLVPDDLLDVRERLLDVVAEERPVRVGVEEVDDAGDAGLGGPAAVVAAERHRALGLPVEGAPLGEDLVPAGVHPRDLDRVLVRLAPAGREERLRQVAGGHFGDEARERRAALLAERWRDVLELRGLLLDRAHDLGVTVAEVHVDEARREVEDLPLAGVEPRALGAGDDERRDRALRRPRHEHVLARVGRNGGGARDGGVGRDGGGVGAHDGGHRRPA